MTKKCNSLLMLFIISCFITASAQTVYITMNDNYYHERSCKCLKHGVVEVDAERAWNDGFRPCKVCGASRPYSIQAKHVEVKKVFNLDFLAKLRTMSKIQIDIELKKVANDWVYEGIVGDQYFWNSKECDAILLFRPNQSGKDDDQVLLMTKNTLINSKILNQIMQYNMQIGKSNETYLSNKAVATTTTYEGKYIKVDREVMKENSVEFIITTLSKK